MTRIILITIHISCFYCTFYEKTKWMGMDGMGKLEITMWLTNKMQISFSETMTDSIEITIANIGLSTTANFADSTVFQGDCHNS